MYGPLILAAFKKAGETPKYSVAKDLSDLLQERYKVVISDKMLVNYYEASKADTKADFKLRTELVHALCEYLGYMDHRDFQKRHRMKDQGFLSRVGVVGMDLLGYSKRNWYALVIIGLVFLLLKPWGWGAESDVNSGKRFMVWIGDRYEEVPPSRLDEYSAEELHDYREDLVRDFKKILDAGCETEFFDAKGGVKVWYGKNKDGELEYFTALAEHPETGKALDDISRYMIRKYICPTY